jgi:hypothetical protein
MRDAFFDTLQAALRRKVDGAHVLKSESYVFPAWVRCDLWIPTGRATTQRCFAIVILEPRPHLEYNICISARLSAAGRLREGNTWNVNTSPDWRVIAEELVSYFLGHRPQPPELFCWSLGRALTAPKDRYPKLEDASSSGCGCAIATVVAILIIPVLLSAPALLLVVVPIGILIAILIALSSPSSRVFDAGRPFQEPEDLTFIDSWHAVLPNLAESSDEVRNKLLKRTSVHALSFSPPVVETVRRLDLNGLVTHDRIVFKSRRALVFCHITPYGNDLYVGWDAYLNRGYWAEDEIPAGSEKPANVKLTSAVAGRWPLSNFDLADVNALDTYVHRQLVGITRQLLALHNIDQQIDFEIIRRQRPDLLDDLNPKDGRDGLKSRSPKIQRMA